MRLALLSALADQPGLSAASGGERPAFRRFAGKSVLAHQIDCAAHLGCDRVLCHAAVLGPDLGSAKLHAERAGMRFEIVESAVHLQAHVTAHDDVILIQDGVLPDQSAVITALADRPTVVAFPADPALELGFERLDATRAWSGALCTRGDSVARLADLPADCDLASSLLRIALQAGARIVELDADALVEGSWQRRVDRQTVQAKEWRWVTRQVKPAPFAAPGRAIVERAGLRWAHDAGGGRWAHVPHGVAAVAGAFAALAAIATWPIAGLALTLVACGALSIAGVFDRVQSLGAPPRKPGLMLPAGRLALDGLLVMLVSQRLMTVPAWLEIALPIVLIGLLRLGEAIAGPRSAALMSDRILLLAALIPLTFLGWTTIAVMALVVLTLAWLLWTVRRLPAKLTAN